MDDKGDRRIELDFEIESARYKKGTDCILDIADIVLAIDPKSYRILDDVYGRLKELEDNEHNLRVALKYGK